MRNERWPMRGRPRGASYSKCDMKLLQYLVTISLKRGIDPNKLFSRIVRAWKNGESVFKQLTIQCREKMEEGAIFLITANQDVIAQFSASAHLLDQKAPLKRFTDAIARERASQLRKGECNRAEYLKIKNLKPGMKGINLKARVSTISKPRQALTRYNTYIIFANATLSDETGTVKLTLWNGKIDSLSVNDDVEIENADITAFRGETQLKIGKRGRLRVIENHEDALAGELKQKSNLRSATTPSIAGE